MLAKQRRGKKFLKDTVKVTFLKTSEQRICMSKNESINSLSGFITHFYTEKGVYQFLSMHVPMQEKSFNTSTKSGLC